MYNIYDEHSKCDKVVESYVWQCYRSLMIDINHIGSDSLIKIRYLVIHNKIGCANTWFYELLATVFVCQEISQMTHLVFSLF